MRRKKKKLIVRKCATCPKFWPLVCILIKFMQLRASIYTEWANPLLNY